MTKTEEQLSNAITTQIPGTHCKAQKDLDGDHFLTVFFGPTDDAVSIDLKLERTKIADVVFDSYDNYGYSITVDSQQRVHQIAQLMQIIEPYMKN